MLFYITNFFLAITIVAGLGLLISSGMGAYLLVTAFFWWLNSKCRSLMVLHLRSAAGYSQTSAEEVLLEKRPYALFLRGFDEEGQMMRPKFEAEIGSHEASVYARPVEALILEMLGKRVPLLALPDPRNPEPLPGAYRFKKVENDWIDLISKIAFDAKAIFLYLSSNSTGVSIELGLLQRMNLYRKTVLIVSRKMAVQNSAEGERIVKEYSIFKNIVFEQLMPGKWKKKDEIDFQQRLKNTLMTLATGVDSDGLLLVEDSRKHYTLTTKSLKERIIYFLQGPIFWATNLFIAFLLLQIYAALNSNEVETLIEQNLLFIILFWPLGVLIFTILKAFFLFQVKNFRSGSNFSTRIFQKKNKLTNVPKNTL